MSNSNTCQHGGNIITKGFSDRFFHDAIHLSFLFQRKHFRTVHNEMDFILIEMHFIVVPYLLKTRGVSSYLSKTRLSSTCHIIFPKREYHAKRCDGKKWFTVASMD